MPSRLRLRPGRNTRNKSLSKHAVKCNLTTQLVKHDHLLRGVNSETQPAVFRFESPTAHPHVGRRVVLHSGRRGEGHPQRGGHTENRCGMVDSYWAAVRRSGSSEQHRRRGGVGACGPACPGIGAARPEIGGCGRAACCGQGGVSPCGTATPAPISWTPCAALLEVRRTGQRVTDLDAARPCPLPRSLLRGH